MVALLVVDLLVSEELLDKDEAVFEELVIAHAARTVVCHCC